MEACSDVMGRRCLIVGNLNIDLSLTGLTQLPHWGQEVVGSGRNRVVAGQAGYMARGVAALEVPVAVAGAVGSDDDGNLIVECLEQAHIDTSLVETIDGSTGLTIALVREDGERAFASDFGVSAQVSAGTLQRSIAESSFDYVALVGTSNLPQVEGTGASSLLQQAAQTSFTLFDPGWPPSGFTDDSRAEILETLQWVDLFLPNSDEALALCATDSVEEALLTLSDHTRGSVVVKLGSEGSVTYSAEAGFHYQAVTPVASANAVGAGDCYDAALLAALFDGIVLSEGMEIATRASAYYVSRSEDRYPNRSTVGLTGRNQVEQEER